VHNSLAGLPDGFNAASVVLFLEPWAAAQSGKVIELADFSSFNFLENIS